MQASEPDDERTVSKVFYHFRETADRSSPQATVENNALDKKLLNFGCRTSMGSSAGYGRISQH